MKPRQTVEEVRAQARDLIRMGLLKGTIYAGGGVLIAGWPSDYPEREDGRASKRGVVKNASAKSLRRCSFCLQNSETKWESMITLTFRAAHADARGVFRRWQDVMPWRGRQDLAWGWFREYQSRGLVHYHYVLGEGVLAEVFGEAPLSTEFVGRGKARREVIRGRAEYWIVSRWVESVGDTSSAFEKFQWGGIVELLRIRDSPGRYLGSYASKAAQKRLPEGELPGGRWWYLSRAAQIVPRGTFTLWNWPLDYKSSIIWDYRQLDPSKDTRNEQVINEL
jgi:hypothetical protein